MSLHNSLTSLTSSSFRASGLIRRRGNFFAAVAVKFTINSPIRVGAPKQHTELVLNGVVCKEGYSIVIPKACVAQSFIKDEQGEYLIHINFDEGRPQAGMGLGYVVDGVPYAYPHNAKKEAIKFCRYQDKGKTLVFNKIEAVFKVK